MGSVCAQGGGIFHRRGATAATILAIGLALWATPATAAAPQACFDEPARAAISCVGTAKTIGKRRGLSFSAPKAAAGHKPAKLQPPSDPVDITNTIPRHVRNWQKRSRKLLMREIANVTRLYKATPNNSKDKPQLMRRLAEAFVELESMAFRGKITAQDKARTLRKSDPTGAGKARKKAKAEARVVKRARDKAIDYYLKLSKRYPKYCRFPFSKGGPPSGCGDEVLYYLAYEYEQAGKSHQARNAYLKLTSNFPNSKYVPAAYLAFGELYFSEAQGDPSAWNLAQQFYEKVVQYPAPKNKLWGYAYYKLGYVHWNKGKYAKAIDAFKKVIEFGMKHPSMPNAKGLSKAARRDIIPVYALKGDATKAWGFLLPLSGPNGGNVDKALGMMEDLGQTLADTGMYPHAIALYSDLIKRNSAGNTCSYQAQISSATMAHKSGKKKPILRALETQIKRYKSFSKENHSAKQKKACANITAALLSETAMAWHIEAVGSGGVRGTNDPNTMAASEKLYRHAIDNFDAAQYKSFKFPRLVKEDWPNPAKLNYAFGDLLFHQGKTERAAPAFEAAYAADPKSPDAAPALYASAVSWQDVFAKRHKGSLRARLVTSDPKLAPRPLSKEQARMVKVFDRYACEVKPPKNDPDAVEKFVEIKYARARTYYENYQFAKAALAFRDIALNHSSSEASVFAGNLYLDSLEAMRGKWGRSSCLAEMQTNVPKLAKAHCGADKLADNEAQCTVIKRVSRHLNRLAAEKLVAEAQKGGAGANAKFAQAGQLYLKYWKTHGKKACRNDEKSCKEYDAELYSAAAAFQAAHLLAKAIKVREILVNPDYHLHQTEPARKATFELGGNYQAIAVYEKAASWYERFAVENRKMDKAAAALSDAVVLRLGLGQQAKALTNAQQFIKLFGRRKPVQAAQIAFAIGAHHADQKQWRKAEKRLRSALSLIEKHAAIDVKLQTYALLGRVYQGLEKPSDAARYYAKVRGFGSDTAGLKKELDATGGSEAKRNRRFGKALGAIAEGMFHVAELERAKADALVFPVYKGARTRKEVDRFVKDKVGDWLVKKVAAIKRADAAYLVITKLNHPNPPPRWVIAAGAAVGNLWGDLVKDTLKAPYPKKWDQPGYIPNSQPPTLWQELRSRYQAALAKAVKPYKLKAKAAYTTCLELGIIHQHFDDEIRTCERWLSKKYPNEFHIVDELHGSPTRKSSGLNERPRPVDVAGKPISKH